MKIKLQIREVVEYNHEITVDAGDINQVDKICSEIENSRNTLVLESLEDYAILLNNKGIKVVELCEDDSGTTEDIECENLYSDND